ncbi:hypothetical protein BDR07DRAFT_1556081 [Suillus spraguei]|nr:hypothetical protein BDR07DRAFT_1556081 [Suillus spraguei]
MRTSGSVSTQSFNFFCVSMSTTNPILHIKLRRWTDIALVAPCSANTLLKSQADSATYHTVVQPVKCLRLAR